MGALRTVRRALRPGGVVLDIHPQPEHAGIECRVDGAWTGIGRLDEADLIGRVRAARAAVGELVRRGSFARDGAAAFEFCYYFDSVDEWLAYMARRWESAIIAPALIERARAVMGAGARELRIREAVHAGRLRRV